jgi:hypothetical protein
MPRAGADPRARRSSIRPDGATSCFQAPRRAFNLVVPTSSGLTGGSFYALQSSNAEPEP